MAPDRVREYAGLAREHGVDLFVMYGQTEATARMAYLPPELALDHPDAIGIPSRAARSGSRRCRTRRPAAASSSTRDRT